MRVLQHCFKKQIKPLQYPVGIAHRYNCNDPQVAVLIRLLFKTTFALYVFGRKVWDDQHMDDEDRFEKRQYEMLDMRDIIADLKNGRNYICNTMDFYCYSGYKVRLSYANGYINVDIYID